MSRALVDAYLAALPLTAVAIVASADRRRSRILVDGEPGPGETVERVLYLKPSHAELVLATFDLDGWADERPAALAARIAAAATQPGRAALFAGRAAQER